MDTLGEHMSIGRDYAPLESLRAFCQGLLEKGCDHFSKVEIQLIRHYWETAEECSQTAVKFYEGYWLGGGCFTALLRAALSHVEVCASAYSLSFDL